MTAPVEYLDLDDVLELAERLLGSPVPLRDVGLLILAGLLAWRPTSRFSVDGLLYPDRRTREVE